MKILHIINDVCTGGAQKIVVDLAFHQTGNGNKVDILTLNDSENSEFYKLIRENPAIGLIEFNGVSVLNPKTFFKLRNLIRHYDIVHVHLFPSGYFAALAATGVKSTLIYTEHSTHNRRRNHKILRPLEQLIYSKYKAVAAISESVKSNLASWLRKESIKEKIYTIPNGVDIEKFADKDAKMPTKDIFGQEGKALIMISRFTNSKDQATVIKALPYLSDKEVFVVFAGDGTTKMQCQQLAADLGMEKRCLFLGTRSDIKTLLKASKIGIQSSIWEGFGLTAVEMMAAGLPVIATDVPGLSDVVANAGILVPPGNPELLAEAIEKLLYDHELYETMKAEGLKRAKDFDISRMAESYMNLYQRAVSV